MSLYPSFVFPFSVSREDDDFSSSRPYFEATFRPDDLSGRHADGNIAGSDFGNVAGNDVNCTVSGAHDADSPPIKSFVTTATPSPPHRPVPQAPTPHAPTAPQASASAPQTPPQPPSSFTNSSSIETTSHGCDATSLQQQQQKQQQQQQPTTNIQDPTSLATTKDFVASSSSSSSVIPNGQIQPEFPPLIENQPEVRGIVCVCA